MVEQEVALVLKENLTITKMSKSDFKYPLNVQVRAGIEQDIVEKSYLYDVLKRECWDSMMIKRTAIKARQKQNPIHTF